MSELEIAVSEILDLFESNNSLNRTKIAEIEDLIENYVCQLYRLTTDEAKVIRR
jgi:hypothetical protein